MKQFFTMAKVDARYLKRFKTVGSSGVSNVFGADACMEVFVPEKAKSAGKYVYDRHCNNKRQNVLAS